MGVCGSGDKQRGGEGEAAFLPPHLLIVCTPKDEARSTGVAGRGLKIGTQALWRPFERRGIEKDTICSEGNTH